MDYRVKTCPNVIRFPIGFTEEDRGLFECCKAFKVLGDVADEIGYKNDVRMPVYKASDVADIVTFRIEKCGIVGFLPNRGVVGDFPEDELIRGFMFDWRQYLANEGPGRYTISIEFTISGVVGGFEEGVYDLFPYSINHAAGTIRVWSEFNSFYQTLLMDFTSSNFKDSIRFGGFFGERQPKTEIVNLIDKGRTIVKTTREYLFEYTLFTNPLEICYTRRLQFLLLNEDTTLISDHNQTNHDYLLFDKSVVLEEFDDMEYRKGSRYASFEAKFGDRKKLNKNYYNAK